VKRCPECGEVICSQCGECHHCDLEGDLDMDEELEPPDLEEPEFERERRQRG